MAQGDDVKILLVDDHPIFLEGLKNLLTLRGLDVVGTARNGWEAIDQAGLLAPDVILMDIIMPGCDGLTATRVIKARQPGIKVVMLTMSETDEDLFSAIKSGAFGYLLKTEDTERLLMRLEGLIRGEVPLSQGLAARVLDEFAQRAPSSGSFAQAARADNHLTSRQIQVLTLVAQGFTYKEIATKLFLTERTIKYHMGEIIERLHLENRRQAIDYARAMKYI